MFGNHLKNCSFFASLISPSKIILFEKEYQEFDTVLHRQTKHLEVRQKYFAARRIFNSLLGVSPGDETLMRLMLGILRQIQPRPQFLLRQTKNPLESCVHYTKWPISKINWH